MPRSPLATLATRCPLSGVAFVLLFSACSKPTSAPTGESDSPRLGDAPEPHPTASTPAIASAPFVHLAIEAGAPRHHLNLICRALALQGSPTIVVDGGAPKPLAMNDLADGWVTLQETDSLTVRLPRTGRELAFLGQGSFDPCVGTDEAWLVRGRFQGSRGSGEAPGAEEWVVTPFGVVRYGAAILEVVVDDTSTRTSLKAGSATVLTEGGTTWESLDPAEARVLKGAPLGKAGSDAAAARCAKATATDKVLADDLALPDAGASPIFADLAMRANDANVVRRAACAIATLRAEAPARPRTR